MDGDRESATAIPVGWAGTSFTYDNEDRMQTKSYPNGGPTYTYGFDSMGRAVSLTDNNGAGVGE